MLGKATRKKLYEHDLITVINKDSNPTQARRRIKAKTNIALRDLNLLSKKTTSSDMEEFLPMTSILAFVDSLLGLNDYNLHRRATDSRISQLAVALVEKALIACMNQNAFLFSDTKSLGDQIYMQLKNTMSICRDIAYKIQLIEQDKIAFHENWIFLFEWSKISQNGLRRFSDYIEYELEIPLDDISIQKTGAKFINLFLSIPFENEPGLASITIKSNDSAKLHIRFGKNTITKNLFIRESSGIKYIFGERRINRHRSSK